MSKMKKKLFRNIEGEFEEAFVEDREELNMADLYTEIENLQENEPDGRNKKAKQAWIKALNKKMELYNKTMNYNCFKLIKDAKKNTTEKGTELIKTGNHITGLSTKDTGAEGEGERTKD